MMLAARHMWAMRATWASVSYASCDVPKGREGAKLPF